MRILEDVILTTTAKLRIDGPLKLDSALFDLFFSLPEDPLPGFQGPGPGKRGRGKDHPRYGRWMHAFVRFYKPEVVVEIGTNAGGTAVGTAKALVENGRGVLICVDNGEGLPRSFPEIARDNIRKTGLPEGRFELICENSDKVIPRLASRLKGKVGVYLIDAAHTYSQALADMVGGFPMMKKGGFVLVHDIDPKLNLGTEASLEHPRPVLEAFQKAAGDNGLDWAILRFIRKHLGVIRV